jgi:hypothetical protein
MCDEHDTRDYATGSHPIVASLRHSSEAGAGRLEAPFSPECAEGRRCGGVLHRDTQSTQCWLAYKLRGG